jgi:BirA family biotin operon repressor/biotin-[acetyl-CoA-carboxylase] ligase
MNAAELQPYLDPLPLGAWQFHPSAGSTNDLALAWAEAGAPDWALVVADSQTAGRGRGERTWVTVPGAALAFSLVLKPSQQEKAYIQRFTTLAALGLINALGAQGYTAEIKWPNDVLMEGRKVAGVLVESAWQAETLAALVVGMGVNVGEGSVPLTGNLRYPAISVEEALGKPVDRWALLAEILQAMMDYREVLTGDAFMGAWNDNLAFMGEWVFFSKPGKEAQPMRVLGVTPGGELLLEGMKGERVSAVAGEIVMCYQD